MNPFLQAVVNTVVTILIFVAAGGVFIGAVQYFIDEWARRMGPVVSDEESKAQMRQLHLELLEARELDHAIRLEIEMADNAYAPFEEALELRRKLFGLRKFDRKEANR